MHRRRVAVTYTQLTQKDIVLALGSFSQPTQTSKLVQLDTEAASWHGKIQKSNKDILQALDTLDKRSKKDTAASEEDE